MVKLVKRIRGMESSTLFYVLLVMIVLLGIGVLAAGGKKPLSPQCNDHIDNDGNGYCDYAGRGAYCSNGLVTLGDPGCGSKTDNSESSPAVCGNNIVEAGEVCDGRSQSCTASGGYPGTQQCNSQCNGWSVCTSTLYCGDSSVDGNETCDYNDPVSGTRGSCVTSSGYAGSESCDSYCSGYLCTSTQFCGDSIKNGPESCDGSDLGGATCQTQGFTSGTLGCTSQCMFDTSACSTTNTTSQANSSAYFTLGFIKYNPESTLMMAEAGAVTFSISQLDCGLGGCLTGCDTSCGGTFGLHVAQYSTATLTVATITPGYLFVGWGDDCSFAGTSTTCTLSMTSDKVVKAFFNVDTSAGSFPDLIVTGAAYSKDGVPVTSASIGDYIIGSVTLKNQGTVQASYYDDLRVQVSFTKDGAPDIPNGGTTIISTTTTLNPGQSYTRTWAPSFQNGPGLYCMKDFVADPQSHIAESDETNNNDFTGSVCITVLNS